MLYWDKAKARRWTGDEGLQLPVAPYPVRAYEDNVYTPADLVKYKMQMQSRCRYLGVTNSNEFFR